MEPLLTLSSRTVVMSAANIDTDQIIPARFLTTTGRSGLGRHLFADRRYDERGTPRADFVLNQPESAGCRILVAGRNFGCGSSREHAAWALTDFGFRAVIASEIADIFASNALKNGLLPVRVPAATAEQLLARPGALLTLDVASRTLTLEDGARVGFPLEPFAQACLMKGVDELGYLLSREAEIGAYERAHP
jgi:3-isopropylmalate/(R)-2-methylmalate dehydratase small subunit